jgi:hypothetical protein
MNEPSKPPTAAPLHGIVMPWDKRAIELEPIEGHYCHYAAWKEWFASWNARQSSVLELDIDELDTVALYAAFCAACSECSSA